MNLYSRPHAFLAANADWAAHPERLHLESEQYASGEVDNEFSGRRPFNSGTALGNAL